MAHKQKIKEKLKTKPISSEEMVWAKKRCGYAFETKILGLDKTEVQFLKVLVLTSRTDVKTFVINLSLLLRSR